MLNTYYKPVDAISFNDMYVDLDCINVEVAETEVSIDIVEAFDYGGSINMHCITLSHEDAVMLGEWLLLNVIPLIQEGD